MADKVIVTGGAGFIGSNFIRHMLANYEMEIINLDALTYAGNLENLSGIETDSRYKFIHGSIADKKLVDDIFARENIYGIINFAAESHVDRSIMDAAPFIDTNIKGTFTLLEAGRKYGISRYLQISTDEIYGSLGDSGKFTEETPVNPKSPYSASKAGADHLVMAYVNTYNFPAMITRCSNNYGPYQFPEKLIPLMILNAMDDKRLPVYADGMNVRDWIFVEDHCRAIAEVFNKGRTGEVYNIGGNCELANIHVVKEILRHLDKPVELIEYVKDRPGHDKRYAMDITKIRAEIGWVPQTTFEAGLEKTIDWYRSNKDWCAHVISGEYHEYYKRQYS